ncbi:NUDIX domain-containing protein [Nannocystis pusilla]|uniref:NUDIX domain-containing protein n=1 Tax=Nannocystis pusilla TaxID=889268 RepID=UPI003DA5C3B5
MPKQSAGILLFRGHGPDLEVLLVHPGGPLWARKDAGAWTIPKGEFGPDEDPLTAARREFAEETGVALVGPFHALSPIRQRAGKVVHAWACRGDCDPAALRSNTFELEWPPRSGKRQKLPRGRPRGVLLAGRRALQDQPRPGRPPRRARAPAGRA